MGTKQILVLILCIGALVCTGKKQTLDDKEDSAVENTRKPYMLLLQKGTYRDMILKITGYL